MHRITYIDSKIFENDLIRKIIFFLSILSLVFCIYAVVNLIIVAQMSGDDISFFKDQRISISWILERYQTWTSRFIVDTASVFFCQHFVCFKILFIFLLFIVIFITYSIACKKFNDCKGRFSFSALLFSVLVATVYPYYLLHSAGFVVTSLNYAFPFISMLVTSYIVIVKSSLLEVKSSSSWLWLVLFILCSVVACNNEMSLLFMAVLSMYKIRSAYGKILFIISIISLLYTIFCPGNHARYIANMHYYLPEYADYNIFDKFYIGLTKTLFQIFYINKIPFIFLFTILVYLRTRSLVLFVAIFFILKRISRFFAHMLDAANINEHNWLATFPTSVLVVMVFLCICTVALILSLDANFKVRFESGMLFILGIGIASSIGFSPSVFASNDRPGYIAQALIIFSAFYIIVDFVSQKMSVHNANNSKTYYKLLLVIVCLVNYNIAVNY